MKIFVLILCCLFGGMVHAQQAVVEEKASEWITVPAVRVATVKKPVRSRKPAPVAAPKKAVPKEEQPFERTNDKVNRFRKPRQ